MTLTLPLRQRPAAGHASITTPRRQQLLPLMAEKAGWMNHAALVFGREDSGLTNEELALADVLTGVPMVADYPSLNLGQSVMVYCYQLSALVQQTSAVSAGVDEISCRHYVCGRSIY
ncbi:putative RNA methyltransferase [Raoultella ornithinolytica]|nr:putative RNA methyltransferase [Raoultella ornithinolytica]